MRRVTTAGNDDASTETTTTDASATTTAARTTSRRSVLTSIAGAGAGLAVLTSTSDLAAGQSSVPVISTRGHFDDDADLTSGHTRTDYDTDGSVPGVDTGCVSDLLVFAHGWKKKGSDAEAEQAALDKFAQADARLDGAGYGGTVVGYSWDNNLGGGFDLGWNESQRIAERNGPKLAAFLEDYASACSGTMRVGCHSLGAGVTFAALEELAASGGPTVDSVHLLGAAVDNERPTDEEPTSYAAVRDYTDGTYNYHSRDDDVLEWAYSTFEWDQALGETGSESGNSVPGNYADRDVTDQVGDDHSGYLENVADEIIADM